VYEEYSIFLVSFSFSYIIHNYMTIYSYVTNFKHVLDTYEAASRQAINYKKSAITYSRNTGTNCRSLINNFLGIVESMGHGKYLGIPSMIGRDKKSISRLLRIVSGRKFRVETRGHFLEPAKRYLSKWLHK
jgi:hypothetical protein